MNSNLSITSSKKKLTKGKLAYKSKPVNMGLSKPMRGRILLVENDALSQGSARKSSAKKESAKKESAKKESFIIKQVKREAKA